MKPLNGEKDKTNFPADPATTQRGLKAAVLTQATSPLKHVKGHVDAMR